MVVEFLAGRTGSGRVGLVSLLAFSLGACASGERDEKRPNPVADIIQATLVDQIPLDSSLGYSKASLSLHLVRLGDQDHLALVVDDGQERPLLIYLPATMRPSETEFLVTLYGNEGRKLTTVLPAPGSGARMGASQFLSTIECVTDYPDERQDLVHIDLDEETDLITAEIWCKRFGPGGFMGFGRDVLYEQAPVTFSLRRTLSVQNARVWLAKGR